MLKFAVIGHPIAHSLSPMMHKANFEALGIEAEYAKFDVELGELVRFIRSKGEEGYLGLNITIPHKIAAIEALDYIDESVKRYGACNTIRYSKDGKIEGFNTDVKGFSSVLERRGFSLGGKKVIILGCGGAGSAIAASCVWAGAKEVLVAARRKASAERLLETLSKLGGTSALGEFNLDDIESARKADLIVNATPVGLKKGDKSLLGAEAFRSGQFVFDIIPTIETPPMALEARKAHAETLDGLDFLVAQGAESFRIWTGFEADEKAMRAIFFNSPLDFPQNIR